MSRAVIRRYRVRFAERGAAEITTANTEFTLSVPAIGAEHSLAKVPVVAGSFVHPLDGATELRPLHVEGIDASGALIAAFSEDGRWVALGRLVDIQWQDAADDPESGEWTTYGTGRCSGLDELDGPGKFRVEISDESWVSRRGVLFQEAGTTSIWPWGLARPKERSDVVVPAGFEDGGTWKGGYGAGSTAICEVFETSGNLYRLRMTGSAGSIAGSRIPEIAKRWIRDDLLPEDEIDPTGASGGNFRHLRLRFDTTDGDLADRVDWEIVSFGPLTVTDLILQTLIDPQVFDAGTVSERVRIHLWIVGQSGVTPAASGGGRLVAPTAPPDRLAPLHIPQTNADALLSPSAGDPHIWEVPISQHGFIHVAEFTRRMWLELGERFDADNLAELAADLSLPAVAVRIDSVPENPEKWAQEVVWGPRMLLALKDRRGRRKLKDLRPPTEGFDLSALPLLNNENSKEHRWRLVGREAINAIEWAFTGLTNVSSGFPSGTPPGQLPDPDALDGFLVQPRALPIIEGDTVPFIGPRLKRFNADGSLVDPQLPVIPFESRCLATVAGVPFRGDVVEQYSQLMLDVYQDGPVRGTCELSGSLAETIEEGDYAIVDCGSVKIANAGTSARTGHVLVLLLSLTRYPAHTEAEYLVYRPVLLFACPDPDDETTWLFSPLNSLATWRGTLDVIDPSPASFGVTLTARKNADAGQQVDMGVAIYEGATLIASWVETDISDTFVAYEFILTAGEQSSITDWNNLFLEISREGETGGEEATWRRIEISEIATA